MTVSVCFIISSNGEMPIFSYAPDVSAYLSAKKLIVNIMNGIKKNMCKVDDYCHTFFYI